MRILFVVHTFPPYSQWGTENYTLNLAKAFSRKHKVAVFTTMPGKYDNKVYQWNIENIPVYAIKNEHIFLRDFRETYLYPEIEKSFIEVVKSFNPDIIHIQHLLFLSVSVIQRAKDMGIPVFLTLADYWYLCPMAQMFRKNKARCSEIKFEICSRCIADYIIYYNRDKKLSGSGLLWKVKKTLGRVLKINSVGYIYRKWLSTHYKRLLYAILEERRKYMFRMLNMCDKIISPSEWVLEVYRSNGIKKELLVHSDYGTDIKVFERIQKKPSGKVRFGYIGSFIPSKGIEIILKATKKIRGGFIINLWGKAPIGWEKYGNHLLKMLKNNPNIILKGPIENKDVPEAYKEIDVLIVPSIWAENSPITIHEAFAAKTPVIGSNIGGIPELIKNGEYGALFPPGDVNALSRIMQKVINNKEIIEQWGKNIPVIKTVEENTKELENLYRKYIKNED